MKQHARNRSRANRLERALKSVGAYEGAMDWKATITDALTDIRHLCDKHNLNFDKINRQAEDHYSGELNLNVAGWEA